MEGIEQILASRYFEIPNNQRGFGWSKSNLEDVISDLKLADTKSHYMGPIIVTRDSTGDLTEDNFTPTVKCILEDGQQRLTAFFLMIRALQLRFIELGGCPSVDSEKLGTLLFYVKGAPKLRLKNENSDLDACFSNCMVGSPPMPGNLTAPMNAMVAAKAWCSELFADMDRGECTQWKNRLIIQARFILVDLNSEGVDRYLTFDAINSRGLPLSQFDKIKNFCILVDSVRSLAQNPDGEWYAALQELEKFTISQRASEEAFITEAFNVFHDTRVSQGEVHQNFVNRYRKLISEPDPILEGDFIGFIKIWAVYAKSFGLMATHNKQTFYGHVCSANAGQWLDRIDNLGLPTITRPLLVAGHIKMTPVDFAKLVRTCEIYTFRIHAVLGRRKDMNAQGIIKLANSILRLGKGIDHVLQTVCGWLSDWATLSDVIKKLSNGEPKYSFDPRISGWGYCYYFLYEYEVSESPAGVSPLPWGADKETKKTTQEHILPQGHRDGGWWEAEWPDEMTAEKFKHRLGNLVLSNGNSILSRKSIEKKLNDSSSAYDYSCANATNSEKIIRNYTDGTSWKKTNILRREVGLIKFAIVRWSIPCSCDNGVIALPDSFGEISETSVIGSFDNVVNELDDEINEDALDEDVSVVEDQVD